MPKQVGLPQNETLRLEGLREPVTVLYDHRRVPHIFAQNDRDLFFAQGFVTARDRLWQMEFQTAATAGRLAEILGPGALERDRLSETRGARIRRQKHAQGNHGRTPDKAPPSRHSRRASTRTSTACAQETSPSSTNFWVTTRNPGRR